MESKNNIEEIVKSFMDNFRSNKVIEALKTITKLIPPGEDYGIVLGESSNLKYLLDREGVVVSSMRLEEGLPFIISTHRRIRWELIPRWIIDDLDPCNLLTQLIKINLEWLNISKGLKHKHIEVAEKLVSLDTSKICST